MNDDELAELLKRTLRNRAASIRPTPRSGVTPELHLVDSATPGRTRRTYAVAGLAVAAATIAIVAAAIGFNWHGRGHLTVNVPPAAPPRVSTPTTVPQTVPPAPATTTTTTLPPIATYPVSPSFAPVSVTFVSPRSGWVLGTTSCETGSCGFLARTTDGGASWEGVPVPTGLSLTNPKTGTVSGDLVRFANLEDGWIVTPTSSGSAIYATFDGGRDWTQFPVPGGVQGTIEDLEASNGEVYALVEASGLHLFSSQVYNANWTESPLVLASPPSASTLPVPIVLQGANGWIIDGNGTTAGGRLVGAGDWAAWPDPCIDTPGFGVLAASSPNDLSVVCQAVSQAAGGSSQGSQATTETLYQSANGGASFTSAGVVPSQNTITSVAQPAGVTDTVVVGTDFGLLLTFDGGKTWSSIYNGSAIGFVGFTTADQGVAITGNTLLMTFDGGKTWNPVSF